MRTIGTRRRGQPLTLRRSEWANHWHLVGGSGSGKSTAMLYWARQLAVGPTGFMLIDPHGQLVEDILSWAAAVRLDQHKQIHIIEPRDADLAPAFNPLAIPADALETGVAAVATAFGMVWDGEDLHEKPRLSRLLRNLLYVLAEHRLTIAEAKLLLAPEHKRLRARLTQSLSNPYFRDEWRELDALISSSGRAWMEFSESVVNRLAPFLSSPVVNRIVGQSVRSLDLSAAMERGDLVLVNLRTSPQFSEEDARLLAALFLNDVRLRAFRRPRGAPPFHVFCDEAPKYMTADVESMLVETRKKSVFVVAAMQNLSQMRTISESTFSTVMAIPNKAVFGKLSMQDATALADEVFAGTFDLEKPKAGHTMPVTVGHRPVWLESMSTSRSHADFEGESESVGESESIGESAGICAPLEIATEDDEALVRESLGTSRSVGATHAYGTSRGRTDAYAESAGEHQTLLPILEERPTALYTLQELQYEAAVRLKQLQPGLAIVKVDGRPPEHIAVPLPRPGLSLKSREFRMWKAQIMARSSAVTPMSIAEREINERRQRLLGAPLRDVEDDLDLDRGVPLARRGTVK